MKSFVSAAIAALTISAASALVVPRCEGHDNGTISSNSTSGGNGAGFSSDGMSFAGSNLYFLHGLSDSDQDAYLSKLKSFGVKVIRVWATGTSSGCQKGSNVATSLPDLESTIGTYDDTVLAALDSTLAKMVANGMKAIISPHDGNLFPNPSGGSGNG